MSKRPSLVELHDAHVRTLRRWVAEGISPDGLGARLRHWRAAGRGWTREQLAAETGLARELIVAFEEGHQHATVKDYAAIVRALAVDPLTVRGLLEPLVVAGAPPDLPDLPPLPPVAAPRRAAPKKVPRQARGPSFCHMCGGRTAPRNGVAWCRLCGPQKGPR